MRCKKCGEVKLSKEFPPFTLIEDCEHPSLHCLRCVTSHWEKHQACSQCNLPVEEESLNLRKCHSILQTLFPEIKSSLDDDNLGDERDAGTITVTRLNGESFDTTFVPTMTVYSLKQRIQKYMKIEPEKQSLIYNHQKLEEFNTDHTALSTLGDYSVKSNTTIHLMVLLYAIPNHLDKVVFDLYWGYPSSGRDYLDAVAVTFHGQQWLDSVDFRRKICANGALQHSGDLMDDFLRQGHHIIKVSLTNMPSHVTHIFFSLSTWKSPTIAHYKTPSMKFYEESRPDRMLCTDQISKAGHRQAIIMCSLSRSGNTWLVHGNGALSDGNLSRMEPILETVQGLIAKTGNYPYVPFKVYYTKVHRI